MIDAYYVRSSKGVMMTGPAELRDGVPYLTGGLVPLKDAVRRDARERGTAVVVDVRGMQRRNMDQSTHRIRIPGSDIWYMTHVQNEDDVFDGFLSNGERLLIPYHNVESDEVLVQGHALSDSCVPVLFVEKGEVLSVGGRKGLYGTIGLMEDIGFAAVVVFDTDGSLGIDDWKYIASRHPGTVPYVRKHVPGLEDLGFDDVIVDH